MSKIAREITKKASTVALAASLFLQPIAVSAVESVNAGDENSIVVEENSNVTETAEETYEEVEVAEETFESIKAEDINVVEVTEALEETKKTAENVVNIPDAELEKIIRGNASIPSTGDITKDDMTKIRTIEIGTYNNVKSLEGLQYCTELTDLTIADVTNMNVSAIKELSSLRYIEIKKGDFNLDNLSNSKGLKGVMLDKVSNTNLNALKDCVEMDDLEIDEAANLNDISAVGNMKKLYALRVRGNEITKNNLTDISVLKGLKELELIDFAYTNISDISVLAELPILRNAVVAFCNIKDVSNLYSAIQEQRLGIIWLDGNKIADPTPIFERKYLFQTAGNQTVTLPEIVTRGGDVVVKLPYDKNRLTDVQVDENVGRYNPETNEITFYNITSDKEVSYKVRIQNNLDMDDIYGSVTEDGGYDYSAVITQPLKIGIPEEKPSQNNGQVTGGNTAVTNPVEKGELIENETAKTGDAGSLGLLSLAAMSIAGAVKSRKRK